MKKVVVLVVALLALAFLAGLSFANLAQANPYLTAFQYFDIEPVTDPPIVSLVSPTNGASYWNGTSIAFQVSMPDSWKWAANEEAAAENWSVFVGRIKSVSCSLDQTQILRNNTVCGFQEEPLRDYHPRNVTYCKNVGFLSPGTHNLTIAVEAYTLYCTLRGLWHNVSVSSAFTFTVGAQPVTPFQNLWIDATIIASVAVVSFGLVAYLLRRKSKKEIAA